MHIYLGDIKIDAIQVDSPLHIVKTLVVFPLELLSDRIPQDQLAMFAAIGCDFFGSLRNQVVPSHKDISKYC